MTARNSSHLTPKTDRGMRTKQKLLAAATKLFGELGYFPTGISDITREAKVSLGTFYTYYESKDEIFRDLVLTNMKSIRKELAQSTKGLTNHNQKEREGIKAFFRFLQKNQYYYRLYRQSEFVDANLHRELFETFAEGYIKGISQSIDEGEIRKLNLELLVYSLMGMLENVGMKWVLWEKREVDDEFIDEIMSLMLNGYANKALGKYMNL